MLSRLTSSVGVKGQVKRGKGERGKKDKDRNKVSERINKGINKEYTKKKKNQEIKKQKKQVK